MKNSSSAYALITHCLGLLKFYPKARASPGKWLGPESERDLISLEMAYPCTFFSIFF